MTPLLADALVQLAMIVIATAGLVGLLVGFELLRGGWEEWRALRSEYNAAGRLARQHTIGPRDRLNTDELPGARLQTVGRPERRR